MSDDFKSWLYLMKTSIKLSLTKTEKRFQKPHAMVILIIDIHSDIMQLSETYAHSLSVSCLTNINLKV